MRELFVKRRAGEVIDFDRVFVETTGLGDPIPVLHTLQTDGLLGAQYRLVVADIPLPQASPGHGKFGVKLHRPLEKRQRVGCTFGMPGLHTQAVSLQSLEGGRSRLLCRRSVLLDRDQ